MTEKEEKENKAKGVRGKGKGQKKGRIYLDTKTLEQCVLIRDIGIRSSLRTSSSPGSAIFSLVYLQSGGQLSFE